MGPAKLVPRSASFRARSLASFRAVGREALGFYPFVPLPAKLWFLTLPPQGSIEDWLRKGKGKNPAKLWFFNSPSAREHQRLASQREG
jgi:hypothetical protein